MFLMQKKSIFSDKKKVELIEKKEEKNDLGFVYLFYVLVQWSDILFLEHDPGKFRTYIVTSYL